MAEDIIVKFCARVGPRSINGRGQGNVASLLFGKYVLNYRQVSPLPLTDPRDAVTRRMLNIPYRIMYLKHFFYSA